ncbi:MAG TPA: hypothetical protein VF519_05855 [Mycobacteriales bacterium]|jgi:hypothetical protein
MGRAENGNEAHAVASARNALLAMTVVTGLLYALVTFGLGAAKASPDAQTASGGAAVEALSASATLLLVLFAGYAVLTFGLHRVSTFAWIGSVCLVGGNAVVLGLNVLDTRSARPVLAILIDLAVLSKLLDTNARRAFLRVGRRQHEALVTEPELAPAAWAGEDRYPGGYPMAYPTYPVYADEPVHAAPAAAPAPAAPAAPAAPTPTPAAAVVAAPPPPPAVPPAPSPHAPQYPSHAPPPPFRRPTQPPPFDYFG